MMRLDLQMNVIPAFESAVASGEAPHFGGLVIENSPAYRVVVFLTPGGATDLSSYIRDPRLGALVEVRRVARSYGQLRSAQARASRLRSVPFDSNINLAANNVELRLVGASSADIAVKAATLRAEAARSGAPLPD